MTAALEATLLADFIRRSVWAYPLLEFVHIAAFSTLFGSLLVLELRVFGAGQALALVPLMRHVVQIALVAFAFAAMSGSLLFISRAAELVVHDVFLVKMGLIAMAGVNALVFHLRGSAHRHDRVARWQAASSLVLWLLVIFCGRLIGYW